MTTEPPMFHVEQSLRPPPLRQLSTDEEIAAYLDAVAQARERLRQLAAERGFEICDSLTR